MYSIIGYLGSWVLEIEVQVLGSVDISGSSDCVRCLRVFGCGNFWKSLQRLDATCMGNQ